MTVRTLSVAMLVLSCSPTLSPQPIDGRTTVAASSTYFWRVTSSTLGWGACSDAADFRASVSALPVGMNSFVIYKTDATAKQARAQSCTSLHPSTCQDSSTGILFDIAGTEMVFVRPVLKEPLRVRDSAGVERDSVCQLTQLENWTLRDLGKTFELEVTNTLGLEDATPPSGECDQIESSLISRSANMAGVRGCVITFSLGGDLH